MLSRHLRANAYAHGIRHTNGPLQEKPSVVVSLITSVSSCPCIKISFPTELTSMTHAAPFLLTLQKCCMQINTLDFAVCVSY